MTDSRKRTAPEPEPVAHMDTGNTGDTTAITINTARLDAIGVPAAFIVLDNLYHVAEASGSPPAGYQMTSSEYIRMEWVSVQGNLLYVIDRGLDKVPRYDCHPTAH